MRRAPILAVGLLLLSSGCPGFSPTAGYTCGPAAPCPDGSTCVSGVCRPQPDGGASSLGACETDGDCSGFSGSHCISQVCRRTCSGEACRGDEVCNPAGSQPACVPADGEPCSAARDCPDGFVCGPSNLTAGSVCLRRCQNYAGCLDGFTCDTSQQGGLCVADLCGPPLGGAQAFGGSCPVSPTLDGQCVGPGGATVGSRGLCRRGGSLPLGAGCDASEPLGAGTSCSPGLGCVGPLPLSQAPASAQATCQPICRGWSPGDCRSGDECYPVWGALGVCVPQASSGTSRGSVNVACSGAVFSNTTPADARPCDRGLICAPDKLCHQMCNANVSGEHDCPMGTTCKSLNIAEKPYLGFCGF